MKFSLFTLHQFVKYLQYKIFNCIFFSLQSLQTPLSYHKKKSPSIGIHNKFVTMLGDYPL